MVGSSANNRRTAAARKAANLEEEARMLSSAGRGPNDADEDDDEDDDDEDECSPEEMTIQLAEYTCLRGAGGLLLPRIRTCIPPSDQCACDRRHDEVV